MRGFKDLSHYTVEINRLENDGDRVVREAIASLFEDGIDPMVVIRWKDIYERLEEAIDAASTSPNVLEGIVIKNSLSRPWAATSSSYIVVAHGAGVRLHQRLPRHRQRDRDVISTRAMSPRAAVAMAAVLNFVGAFISLEVAATVAKGIVEPDAITHDDRLRRPDRRDRLEPRHVVVRPAVVLVARADRRHGRLGLRGRRRPGAIDGDGILEKVVIPALIAPDAGLRRRRASRSSSPTASSAASGPGSVNRGYRLGQLVTGSLFSLAHGTNDAQKTMGIITLALIAHGNLRADDFDVPTWVVVSSATAIALGTYSGGWRIIRTMGSRIIKMDPAQGFSAQGAGAAVVLTASHLGFPLSTTHVISGGVMGAGAAKRAVGGALGRGRQHRRRLGPDAARRGVIGGAGLRRCARSSATDALGRVIVVAARHRPAVAAFGARCAAGPRSPRRPDPCRAASTWERCWSSSGRAGGRRRRGAHASRS